MGCSRNPERLREEWELCRVPSFCAVTGKLGPGIRERPTEDLRIHACRISFEISCLSNSSLKNTMLFWFFIIIWMRVNHWLIVSGTCQAKAFFEARDWTRWLELWVETSCGSISITQNLTSLMVFLLSSSLNSLEHWEPWRYSGLECMRLLLRAAGQCIREPLGGSTQTQVSVRFPAAGLSRHPRDTISCFDIKISSHAKIRNISKQ